MLTNDQLRILQERVQSAVSRIRTLYEENKMLKRKLSSYEKRVADLEAHFSSVQEGQSEMEKGILSALDSLDQLEDEFTPSPVSQHTSPPSPHTSSQSNNLIDDLDS